MKADIFAKAGIIILIIMISGCSYTMRKRTDNLETALTKYSVALRWAQYQDAYNYHVSPEGTQPPVNLKRLDEISVTKVKPVEKIINKDHTEATIKYLISYFYKTQGTLKELRVEHKWWVNQKTNQWFIDGEFPDFFK